MGPWRLPLALTAFFSIGLARAEAPPEFVKLRDQARPVESLSAFLDHFVGNCGADVFERSTCEANSRRTRAEMTGKLFHLILDDGRTLQAGSFDPSTRDFVVNMTPFLESGGLALTDGAPTETDREGHPRIRFLPLHAFLPETWTKMDMDRQLRTQNIRIHIVFKPLGLWSLPGKGKDRLEGVKAKFLAVRLTDARTGDDLALYTSR